MVEKEQYQKLPRSSVGYISHPLRVYDNDPSWFADPKITPFREVSGRARSGAYAGKLGQAAAAVLADFVVVDMFAVRTVKLKPTDNDALNFLVLVFDE